MGEFFSVSVAKKENYNLSITKKVKYDLVVNLSKSYDLFLIATKNLNLEIEEKKKYNMLLDTKWCTEITGEGDIMVTHTAGENIVAGRAVMLNNSKLLFHCNGYDITHSGRAIGVSSNNALVGEAVNVKYVGALVLPYTLITGQEYYIGLDGALVTDVDRGIVFRQKIGVATGVSEIFVNVSGADIVDDLNATVVKAGESLSGHTVVVYDSSGGVVHADSSNIQHSNKVAGVMVGAVVTNNYGLMQEEGELTEPSWNWDTAKGLFFNSSGQIVQDVPQTGFVCSLGYVINSNTIYINIDTNNIII